MKQLLISTAVLILVSLSVSAQKGSDEQTQTVKEGSNISRVGNDVSRTWSFGKGKTKIRKRLANPYELNSRQDILIETIVYLLKDNKMIVDEAASDFEQGLIVTQPFTFIKGSILTKGELGRYAILPVSDNTWTRGRFTLTIDVRSIDGIRNNVGVTAKVEGRSENGIFSEWSTLESSGNAEDEFLALLVGELTGGLPDGERKP